MAKYIAERHMVSRGRVIQPGDEVEIGKDHEKSMIEVGWIREIPKKETPKKTTAANTKKADADSDK